MWIRKIIRNLPKVYFEIPMVKHMSVSRELLYFPDNFLYNLCPVKMKYGRFYAYMDTKNLQKLTHIILLEQTW